MGLLLAQTPDSTTTRPSIELEPALDRVLRDYEQAWQGRDAQALADLFTADGFILRPGHPPVRGRANIKEAYQNSGGPLALRALAVSTADSVGYIIGVYAIQPGEPDIGKFILALHKDQTGRWYIVADMDNGNQRY